MSTLIDVDKLKNTIKNPGIDLPIDKATENEVLFIIEKQPTVDAAPVVHAHWWVQEDVYCCSNCHCRVRLDKSSDLWKVDKYQFCPMCGARIDEETV